MLSTPALAQRRFPLHIHISAMFTLLLLLTGVVLGLYNYQPVSYTHLTLPTILLV